MMKIEISFDGEGDEEKKVAPTPFQRKVAKMLALVNSDSGSMDVAMISSRFRLR